MERRDDPSGSTRRSLSPACRTAFLVGRIWDEARDGPLREAIAVTARDASRAIAVAGITLGWLEPAADSGRAQ